eukprot:scaffold13478_cov132-Cylindrotheca_fusiformis.AAC.31
MELPEPAIRWLVQNAASNEELARLSNVSKKWRSSTAAAILDQARKSLSGEQKQNSLLLLPSFVSALLRQGKAGSRDNETFCLSWFHPAGIESRQLPLDPANDTDEEEDEMMNGGQRGDSPEHFAPSGHESYVGSEEERTSPPRRRSSKSANDGAASAGSRSWVKTQEGYVHCMHQWNSYKEADEVLGPFGFSSQFVQVSHSLLFHYYIWHLRSHTLQTLIDLSTPKEIATTNNGPANDSKQNYSTYAVRGATLARPEGYCLCWDEDLPELDSPSIPVKADASSLAKQNELRRLARRRARRRREVQREVLPRVICSTPFKSGTQPGAQQAAVQFLNVDFSHAVRLFTPPFKPGPVSTPITIFCVAIATEDGCFLSGLQNRFEFGHLYPQHAHESLVERSPICICSKFDQDPPKGDIQGGRGESVYRKIDSYNSDDSSHDGSAQGDTFDPPTKCACPFSGLGHITEDDNDDDEEFGQICRGHRGPGLWHCYSLVVDGTSSVIRIDGAPEPLRCSRSIGPNAVAYLDGLTIGADHTFDMSLCFGQGSDGEGEGAISELAVFKGKLGTDDIEAMESYLMKKHGIPSSTLPESELLKDDNYWRLAHAMLSHPPRHKVFANGAMNVPLRYMTKHRSVSWKQINPVTGERIKVSRIGTKSTESSSDW